MIEDTHGFEVLSPLGFGHGLFTNPVEIDITGVNHSLPVEKNLDPGESPALRSAVEYLSLRM